MCVIYACSTEIPDEEELHSGAFRNDDGAGIAWIDKAGGKDQIFWKKGLENEKDVLKFIQHEGLKPPLVIHFRKASVGGKLPELCHPFPLTEDVELDLEGSCDELLFHNGHLNNWDDLVVRAALGMDTQVPSGEWSDTRALAWLAALKGTGIIQFLHGTSRVLTFHATPDLWEGCDYDRAHDHFTLWGSWAKQVDGKGWRQSIETEWMGGGTVVRGKGFRPTSYETYVTGGDDSEESSCESVEVWKGAGDGSTLNIWTVSELREILARAEKELADARTASGV